MMPFQSLQSFQFRSLETGSTGSTWRFPLGQNPTVQAVTASSCIRAAFPTEPSPAPTNYLPYLQARFDHVMVSALNRPVLSWSHPAGACWLLGATVFTVQTVSTAEQRGCRDFDAGKSIQNLRCQ